MSSEDEKLTDMHIHMLHDLVTHMELLEQRIRDLETDMIFYTDKVNE